MNLVGAKPVRDFAEKVGIPPDDLQRLIAAGSGPPVVTIGSATLVLVRAGYRWFREQYAINRGTAAGCA